MKIFLVVSYSSGIPIALSLALLYVFPPLIYLYFIFSRILHPSFFLSLFLSFPHHLFPLSLSHSLCLLLSPPSSLSLSLTLSLSLSHSESNLCYGEGGAGTWSDGKLTTSIGIVSETKLLIMKPIITHYYTNNCSL